MFARLTLLLTLAALPLAAQAQTFKAPNLSEYEQRTLADARAYEARGDEERAFETYRLFLQSDRDAVDVALRFAAIARVRMGLVPAQALLR